VLLRQNKAARHHPQRTPGKREQGQGQEKVRERIEGGRGRGENGGKEKKKEERYVEYKS